MPLAVINETDTLLMLESMILNKNIKQQGLSTF